MQQGDSEPATKPYSGLVNRIESDMPRMSKGQKAIARFILSDYGREAFMPAARLG